MIGARTSTDGLAPSILVPDMPVRLESAVFSATGEDGWSGCDCRRPSGRLMFERALDLAAIYMVICALAAAATQHRSRCHA